MKIIVSVGLAAAIIILFIIVRLVSTGSGSDPRKANLPQVKVDQVRRQRITEKLEFQGDVLSIQQANIFSKVNGTLEHIYADMGSFATKGQMLALIDTTELWQAFQQASATYENAKLNYDRTKELAEQNLLAKQDLDNAETSMKVALANCETARTKLGYARITAPFSGFVTKRFLDPGALVSSNSVTLFTLMDLDEMKVIVNVLEKDLPSVKIGTNAILSVDAYPGQEFTGNVARMSQAIDLSTRTMAVEIDIPNKSHLLRPGMFATVRMITKDHPNAMTVPTQAILQDDRGSYLFVVSGSAARRVNVVTGIEQKGWTEILTGLSGNEPVITTGPQFVKDGGQVNVQPS